MFKRPWQVWLSYAAAVAILLPAFGWLTMRVLQLDDDQRIARRTAEHEEQVRLALWRMDSLLMPLIAQEAARPYLTYEPFSLHNDMRIPSPILTPPSPFVLLNFQVGSDGTVHTPQYPDPEWHEWAVLNGTTVAVLQNSGLRRDELSETLQFNDLWAQLPEETLPALAIASVSAADEDNPSLPIPFHTIAQSLPDTQQTSLDPGPQPDIEPKDGLALAESLQQAEFGRRNSVLQNLAQQQVVQQRAAPTLPELAETIDEGVSRPLWLDQRLILARRVTAGGEPVIQGCWLNWESLQEALLLEIADLVPQASLVPLSDPQAGDPSRLLASIPVSLRAEIPPADSVGSTPIRAAVITAWFGLIVACVAIALLLHGVHSLSERRAAFVSAVTHELRTPLTTFQLYTDLLADDLLKDERKRRDYLQTLRGESQRLEHLIENVLCYSQLERRPGPAPDQVAEMDELLDRVAPRLQNRVERSGMELVIDHDESVGVTRVRADPSLVEQILVNLVDNACKYAADAEDRRILIHTSQDGTHAAITIRDFGPGIPADVHRRLFQPFSKSAERAAESAPGVGLGLALSRGLARQMGGDLAVVDNGAPGTAFRLALTLASN